MIKARSIAAKLSQQQHASRKQLQKALGFVHHLALVVVWSARTKLRRALHRPTLAAASRSGTTCSSFVASSSFFVGRPRSNGSAGAS
jgi:hypothetical protein